MSKQTVILNSSQMVDLAKCPMKWHLRWNKNLYLKGVDRQSLDKGTIAHGLAERYYTARWNGESWTAAYLYAIRELKSGLKEFCEKSEIKLEEGDFRFLFERFTAYAAMYQDETVRVATIEKDGVKKPAVEVGFSVPMLDTEDYLFILEGRIDLIAEQQGLQIIYDHKTQQRKRTLYARDIQPLNYCLASAIDRFCYNYIGLQATVNKDTFRRDLHYYGALVLKRHREWVLRQFFTAASLLNCDNYEQRWAMCKGDYGKPCVFTHICEQTDEQIAWAKQGLLYTIKPAYRSWRLEENDDAE